MIKRSFKLHGKCRLTLRTDASVRMQDIFVKPFQGLKETTPMTEKLVVGSVYIDNATKVNYCNGKIKQQC